MTGVVIVHIIKYCIFETIKQLCIIELKILRLHYIN